MLDILFCTDQAWLQFSGYINSQNSTVWSAENPHALYESPLYSSELVFHAQVSRKWIVGPLFFEHMFAVEDYPCLLTSSLVCWKVINGVFGLARRANTANTPAAFLQKFFGVLIICRLGHHDHQTSRHLTTCIWWDFLNIESVAVTEEVRRTLNVTLQRLLQTLTNKLLKKLQDTAIGVNACLRGGGGHCQLLLWLEIVYHIVCISE